MSVNNKTRAQSQCIRCKSRRASRHGYFCPDCWLEVSAEAQPGAMRRFADYIRKVSAHSQ